MREGARTESMISFDTVIEALTELKSPNRTIDGDIAELLELCPKSMERFAFGEWGGGDKRQWDAPRYTESLDAALSLVPEDARWALGVRFDNLAFAACDIKGYMPLEVVVEKETYPAIVLCIAALQAIREKRKALDNDRKSA